MASSKHSLFQILVFLAFFPYPAIFHFGNTAGVQVSDVLAIFIVLLALPKILQARSALAYVVLLAPIFVSLGALALIGWRGDVDLAIRVTIAAIFSLLILPAGGSLMRHSQIDWLVTPVSLAICLHALVGFWQYRVFPQGSFPLLSIFQNPSFHDLQGISTSYALYVGRPFGLFPEPSAMAAAIGPWILFLLWYGLRPATRGNKRALVGATAGTILILLSQSIYVVFLLPCALLIMLLHRRTSARGPFLVEILAWGLAVVGMLLFPVLSSGRVEGGLDNSTQGRLTSLVVGVAQPFTDIITFFFGIGPGQNATIFESKGTGVTAIYSVIVSAFAEGGLIALLAMAYVCRMCIQGHHPGYRYVFLFAWVAGIGFTTSYVSLGPVWLFLAMILDMEFDDASSSRDPEFGLRRSRATPRVPGVGAEQGL